MRVVVGASSFAQSSNKAISLLKEKGIEVVLNPYCRKMNENEIIEHLKGADGLLAGLEPLNEKVLSESPQLKAIARIGIGIDNIDFEACNRFGVKVSNTPDAPTDAVAEMTIAALLAIAHQIIPSNEDVHHGVWKKRLGFSLRGANVLVIGYGRIGRKVANVLRTMGSKVFVYDPYLKDIVEGKVESLEIGLASADVVSFHASGKEEFFTSDMFRAVKSGAVFLNCARGELLNEDALYENLKSGKISYYWGDVFWQEPYNGKLTELDNALLTPHISTYNSLCRESMETEAVKNLLRDLGYDS